MDELKDRESERLYVMYHGDVPVGYAYGRPWVSQALLMDDIRYDTPEAAIAAWERWKAAHPDE